MFIQQIRQAFTTEHQPVRSYIKENIFLEGQTIQQTDEPTNQPSDGHDGSSGSYSSHKTQIIIQKNTAATITMRHCYKHERWSEANTRKNLFCIQRISTITDNFPLILCPLHLPAIFWPHFNVCVCVQGIYVCEASNRGGKISASAIITVQVHSLQGDQLSGPGHLFGNLSGAYVTMLPICMIVAYFNLYLSKIS